MHDDWFPAGWLQPGRMVVEEQLDDNMVVHVRLDCGVTCQRIPAKDEDAVAGVLRQLGRRRVDGRGRGMKIRHTMLLGSGDEPADRPAGILRRVPSTSRIPHRTGTPPKPA